MKYKCWTDPDDPIVVGAGSYEGAAERYAQRECNADCHCYKNWENDGQVVTVQQVGDGAKAKIRVRVEFIPTFYSEEAT